MSNSGVWGPTPPGVDLSQNQNSNIIGAITVCLILAFAAVFFRFYARTSRRGPGLGVDDYAVIVALILNVGNATICLISMRFGAGYHLWRVTVDQFIQLYQTTFAYVIVYIWSVTSYKIAILLFYRRIFGSWTAWYVVTGLTIAHGLEVTITWLSGCQPISWYWRQYTDPTAHGHCINASEFYLANGIIALIIDVSILLAPLPIIWKLQMDKKQKVAVCGILLLGSFVCLSSIVRIVFLERLVKAHDFTWAMCQVFIWSAVEPSLGIVCACLPTYAPLLRRWTQAYRTRHTKGSTGATPNFPSGNSKGGKHEWSRIKVRGPLSMPDDDDVELAHDDKNAPPMPHGQPQYAYRVGVSSADNVSSDGSQNGKEIVVTKGFSWSS